MITIDRVLAVVDRPDIPAPTIDYGLLMPLIVVFAVAMLGLIVEIVVPRDKRFVSQVVVAVGGLLAGLASTIKLYLDLSEAEGSVLARGQIGGVGSVAVDGPGVVTWGLILVFSILSMLLFAERSYEGGLSAFTGRASDAPGSKDEAEATAARLEHTEVFPLAIFAVVGMMLFAVSHDLITMFVALEVLSLPLYVLAGLARRKRLISQEAALKYFLLGAFASAFFLYGAALAYGFSGSLNLTEINAAITARDDAQPLILGSIAMIAVGLLFKIGAAPFHSWTPDVYQGAPNARHCVHGFGNQSGRVHCAHAGFLRRFRRCVVGLAPSRVGYRHRHDAHRLGRRHCANGHQAHARLLVRRARRLCPRGLLGCLHGNRGH